MSLRNDGFIKEVLIEVTTTAEVKGKIIFFDGKIMNLTGRVVYFNNGDVFKSMFYSDAMSDKIKGQFPLKFHYKFVTTHLNDVRKKEFENYISNYFRKIDPEFSLEKTAKVYSIRTSGELGIEIVIRPSIELDLRGTIENIRIIEAENVPGLKDVSKK